MIDYNGMLAHSYKTAKNKISSSLVKTLILSYLGGIFVAVGGFTSTIASYTIDNYSVMKLMQAATFPIGLLMVVICGGEIFTGNCLIFFGVLDKTVKIKKFLTNLIIVLIGNAAGTLTISLLLSLGGLLNQKELSDYIISVAVNKASLNVPVIFVRAVLCNIVVCLAIWGSYAAKAVSGKFLFLYFTIFTFVLTGTEHSVANIYYFWTGAFASYISKGASSFSFAGAITNIAVSAAGNFIGAVFFICILYWYIGRKNDKV